MVNNAVRTRLDETPTIAPPTSSGGEHVEEPGDGAHIGHGLHDVAPATSLKKFDGHFKHPCWVLRIDPKGHLQSEL